MTTTTWSGSRKNMSATRRVSARVTSNSGWRARSTVAVAGSHSTPSIRATVRMRVSGRSTPRRRAVASMSTIPTGRGTCPTRCRRRGFPRLPRRRFARAAAVIARRASLWMNPHTSGTLWVIMVRPSMVLPNALRTELKDFPSAISSRDNPCMCLGPGSSGTDNTAWKSESGSPEAVNTTASMTTSCAVDG